jgi:3-mercaptopyruvate sulfurtransferase SseA
MYLSTASFAGTILLQFLQLRGDSPGNMFSAGAASVIAQRLKNMGLEVRSVRRGGLQEMDAAGLPLTQIMQFSKHTSVKMLMKYLNYTCQDDATQMLQNIERVDAARR